GRPLAAAWEQVQRAGPVIMARQAGLADGPFEGEARTLAASLAVRYGPDHIWSASRLEVYGACRFRFFVENALGLEQRTAPVAGFDFAQLGGMLHTILERVYQAAGDPGDLAALLE